jgi:hypothetical protein
MNDNVASFSESFSVLAFAEQCNLHAVAVYMGASWLVELWNIFHFRDV